MKEVIMSFEHYEHLIKFEELLEHKEIYAMVQERMTN